MKPSVFIAIPVPPEVEEYIGTYCNCRIWSSETPISEAELLKEVKDVDGLMVNEQHKINRRLLDNSTRLKVVSTTAVGFDNLDLESMKMKEIIGTHTPGVMNDAVVDLAFGMMLATARRILELDRFVKNGSWRHKLGRDYFGLDVHHTTLGIIGMGRIGEVMAKRAIHGFDMTVKYFNRRRKPDIEKQLGVEYLPLLELLSQSDFVALLTPLTSQTAGLIGRNELSVMKKTAIFINISRGGIVDEKALEEMVKTNRISGAGVDVFSREPIDMENPLLDTPNIITLPHIGSATAKTRFDMAMMAARNLVAVVTGGQPINPVPNI